jgi:5'-nucleotidase
MLYRLIGRRQGELRVDSRRITRLVAAGFAAALVVAGCGGGGDDESTIPQSGERETTTTTEATATPAAEGEGDAAAGEALQVLVTNDDGVGAAGIDALVTALTAVEGVEVTVVAPTTQQSGTGGNATDGPLTSTPATTAGGYEATAVEGFPADTIRVAFDDMGLTPDLVISGINEGQNLGPVVDASGTVGAARAGLRRGVPALAVSQGLGVALDYTAAADLVITWLDENRAAIVAGELPVDVLANLNVPTCTTGELRGSLEVALTTVGDPMAPSDCASTGEGFTDDLTAFANGYATFTEVAVEPAVQPAA